MNADVEELGLVLTLSHIDRVPLGRAKRTIAGLSYMHAWDDCSMGGLDLYYTIIIFYCYIFVGIGK